MSIKQLLQVVQLSFSANMFVALGTVFAQIRGSTIGNQISPIISSITVMMQEVTWQQQFSLFLRSNRLSFFLCRYVDNRFVIFAEHLRRDPAIRTLRDKWFYQKPVEIEVVEDNHFLGFYIDVACRTIRFIQPKSACQFRLPDSAGARAHLVSGFRSRCSLICAHTYPSDLIETDLRTLLDAYVQFGFAHSELQPISARMLRCCKN